MVATGQNIKRFLRKCGWGRRPIPRGVAGEAPFLLFSVPIESIITTVSRRTAVMQVTGI
jgi:hypothetical protein